MFSWFKKTKKEEEDPAQVIDTTIIEMEGAIRNSIASLNQLARNYKDMQEKVAQLNYEAHELGKEALKTVKQGKEMDAKHLLARKADAETQGKQYQQIAQEMEVSIKKLEKQVSKMKVQLDETKSKRAVLVAEYASAKTQKELSQKLQELNIQTDVFEGSIIQTQIEAGLSEESQDPLLKEFELLEQSDANIEQLRKQAEEEEKRQKQLQEENKRKQIGLLLGNDFLREKKSENQEVDKKNILQGFFEQTKTQAKQPASQENNWQDFFKSESKETKTINLEEFFDKENNLCFDIDNFFEEHKKKNPMEDFFSEQEKNELAALELKLKDSSAQPKDDFSQKFGDFFSNENDKNDKKKAIDDFFKD